LSTILEAQVNEMSHQKFWYFLGASFFIIILPQNDEYLLEMSDSCTL